MTGTDLRQRLAAILSADVAGYSRLMGMDERATVAALDAARAVFRAHIESNQGRVIDMAGDSVLAVFETASGAVLAALAVQRQLRTLTADVPEERRMRFRVGIHLGDVIEKPDGTVYGDGVNIAARLQSLADAGGIAISDAVQGAVRGNVSVSFVDQGEQTVKNISHPVRAFAVRESESDISRLSPGPLKLDLSLPEKPSIAVLPFANMGGDVEHEYLTDGITEEVITELSRFHSLFVIARNSTFTFKGKAVDVRNVAKELGVHYVLEGSIRRVANRVRVTAQLIDALTGSHLWAEKYDRVIEDIFNVQEEVTRAIVAQIAPHIEVSEAARTRGGRSGNLSAYEIAMRGWAAAQVGFAEGDRASRDEALRFARDALALDPRCGVALRTLAWAQWQHILFNTAASAAQAREEGISAATRAIAIDYEDHIAYLWKGALLFLSGQYAAGLADARRAHELNPNDALTLCYLGFFEAMSGDPKKGIDCISAGLRLSPRDRSRYLFFNCLGYAHFAAGEYAQGAEWAQRSIGEAPKMPSPHLCLVLNLVGLAEIAKAKSELQVLRDLNAKLVEKRLAGQWNCSSPEVLGRATTFLHVAAGLEEPSTADALR